MMMIMMMWRRSPKMERSCRFPKFRFTGIGFPKFRITGRGYHKFRFTVRGFHKFRITVRGLPKFRITGRDLFQEIDHCDLRELMITQTLYSIVQPHPGHRKKILEAFSLCSTLRGPNLASESVLGWKTREPRMKNSLVKNVLKMSLPPFLADLRKWSRTQE